MLRRARHARWRLPDCLSMFEFKFVLTFLRAALQSHTGKLKKLAGHFLLAVVADLAAHWILGLLRSGVTAGN
jgi:hypothetical protein